MLKRFEALSRSGLIRELNEYSHETEYFPFRARTLLTGARIVCDTLAPRIQRGAGRVVVERIPYLAEDIVAFLEGVEQLILVGTKPPVTFFAYPGKPSWPTPESCEIMVLSHAHEDGTAALEALADALNAPPAPVQRRCAHHAGSAAEREARCSRGDGSDRALSSGRCHRR